MEILSRLPTESVVDSKLVCRNWNAIISHHPSFYRMYLHHLLHPSADDSGKLGYIVLTQIRRISKFHYFEYNDDESTPIQRIARLNFTCPLRNPTFIGSCNGLICLANRLTDSVCICNPFTREYVILPEIENQNCEFSFGYVSSADEYKIVGMCKAKANVQVHIYTLGSGTGWRNLGNFISHFPSFSQCSLQGEFAYGALYWVDEKLQTIVTFDLAEEKFFKNLSPHPFPPGTDWRDWYHWTGVLDGFLYIAITSMVEVQEYYDIWLLKNKKDIQNQEMNEQEEHQSLVWCKEFRLDVDRCKLLAVTKCDGVLIYNDNYLNIYCTRTSTLKRLVKFKDWIHRVSPHKNTLVSLKELGEEDTKAMESVQVEETRSRDYTFEQL